MGPPVTHPVCYPGRLNLNLHPSLHAMYILFLLICSIIYFIQLERNYTTPRGFQHRREHEDYLNRRKR